MFKINCVLLIVLIFQLNEIHGGDLEEIFKWKHIEYVSADNKNEKTDFVFPDALRHMHMPSHTHRPSSHRPPSYRPPPPQPQQPQPNNNNNNNNNDNYIQFNSLPMGVNHYKGKLFITVPRRRPGIPSTLNYIDLKVLPAGEKSPKLTAYPNNLINSLQPDLHPDNNRIISVYRTRIDVCNRLWFIDTGMLEYPNNRTQVQPPSIWIIDLNTGETIRRFEIPSTIVNVGRGLASITVDVEKNSCNDAHAYIPDLFAYGLYVYSFRNNNIWRFQHNYLSFDPLSGDLDIANQKFQWNDGIFSITLGNKLPDGYRNVYFHPMASTSEFSVSSKVLKNQANADRDWHGTDFKHLGSRGPMKQSTMHDFDSKSETIFYAEISKYGIGCWNTQKPFSSENQATLQTNTMTMIYPSDLTIDEDGFVWMMTNSLPIFIYSKLDPNEYNFRVWKQNAQTLVRNSVCQN